MARATEQRGPANAASAPDGPVLTPLPRSATKPRPTKSAVPYVAVSLAELTTRALDPKRAFLISMVDGCSPIETLLDLSGMPEDEAMELFADLLAQRVLALR